MGCQCGREDLSESILNHFWNELNLRSKSHQDIIDMIRSKKQSANEQIKENTYTGKMFYQKKRRCFSLILNAIIS